MLLLRVSQAGGASSAHLESDQPANTSPAGKPAGKEIKGAWEEAGRGSCEARVQAVPLLSPGLGRTQPWPQHPTFGLQGVPCLCTPSPNSPWRPQGGKMKSGRSKAFFKHILRLHIQED